MNQGIAKLIALFLATLAASAAAAPTCTTDTTQANFQAGVANGVDLTTSPGDVLLASSSSTSGTLDQQNTTLTTNGEVFSDTQWTAQTFIAGMSGPLTRVDLNLFCYLCSGYTPPSITVGIRQTLGGTDLATATTTIDNTGVPKFYTANFATPATLTAGTQYAIVIRASSTPARTLAFTIGSASTYNGGTVELSKNSGSTWTAETYDGGFKTYVKTGGTGYNSAGDLISSLKDAAPPTGTVPTWQTLSFTDNVPANTTLRFQVAASNSSGGPFAFVGPDGTAGTYFTTSGASLSRFNGNRYLKYRAYLSTGSSSSTPALNDATVCYTDVTPSADLSITNSDGVTTAAPGGSVVYTITASNSGPNGVTGASVSDTFPSSLTCSWTCAGAGGGTCPATSGSGSINALVSLPASASVTYTATCSIASNASGTLTNSASISPPSGVSDPNLGNNTSSDSDTLQAATNIALTMTDNLDMVKLGQIVDYVIEVTNSNSISNASVTVGDTLPSQLTGGSWTCTGTNGATCGSASGSGNKLSDSPTLPSGSKVDYLYTATVVSADANGQVANTATVKVTSSGNQSALSLSANDADIVVIFANSFDGAAAKAAATTVAGTGGGSVTLHLGVDAGLAGTVGTTPVTIGSGRAADGATLFSLQLVRLGGGLAMRTITTLDGGTFSDASPWAPVNLNQGTFDLTWQPASARGDDGFLRAGSLPLSATNARASLAQLQIESVRGVPWLVAIPH